MAVRSQRRKVLRWAGLIVPVLVGVFVALTWEQWECFSRTGRFSPISTIETLNSPIAVSGISTSGLRLGDNREVRLPGLTSLPAESLALRAVTASGIEIAADGQVYGLLPIHHWCGSDPVRTHVARLDIAHLLMFFGEGEPRHPLARLGTNATFRWSEYGWDVSEYFVFRQFEAMLATSQPATSVAR